MPASDVEEAVQTAIHYAAHPKISRAWQSRKGTGWLWYAAALAVGGLLLYLKWRASGLEDQLTTLFVLTAVIGGYFWIFIPMRLPDFYDQNKISFFYDGPLRMNLLGVRFTNRNWPFVVRAARAWSCVLLVLLPLLYLVLTWLLFPEGVALNSAVLFGFLGSFFIPLYLAAVRHA